MGRPKTIRCTIYSRKSSEEGLEQEFNSLDAQREACEAYIVSQKHEGWKLVKTRYDDGGFSGGTLERPALKRLLDDIERGVVDVVVVYKMDRLTRSLLDFARIVERFDQNNVSFVAVTQHFNTTSSMGRLTLNVLLSFAQFEREVTGERIRDKIAASKKKGMWMGGPTPLGYNLKDRRLLVNKAEAEQVRTIYKCYLEVGSVTELVAYLKRLGIRSKSWVSARGIQHGGNHIGRGALYLMLQNRLYLGEIVHKDKSYPGEHEAIVQPDLWDKVQDKLKQNRVERRSLQTQKTTYLLAGVLFDDEGNAMVPHYSVKKNSSRYRYYVSVVALRGEKSAAGAVSRISAATIESLIEARLTRWMRKTSARAWTDLTISGKQSALRSYIKRIEISENEIAIELQKEAATELTRLQDATENSGDTIRTYAEGCCIAIPYYLTRRGGRQVLTGKDGRTSIGEPTTDLTLIRNISQSYRWRERLESGDVDSMAEIAKERGCTERHVHKLLPLAFLAPDIIEAILDGRQPVTLTLDDITKSKAPLSWERQHEMYGFLQPANSYCTTHFSLSFIHLSAGRRAWLNLPSRSRQDSNHESGRPLKTGPRKVMRERIGRFGPENTIRGNWPG